MGVGELLLHGDEAVAQVIRPGALVVPPRLGLIRARLRRAAVGVRRVRTCFGSLPALPFLICSSLSRVRPFVRPVEQAADNRARTPTIVRVFVCGRLIGRSIGRTTPWLYGRHYHPAPAPVCARQNVAGLRAHAIASAARAAVLPRATC